MRNIWYFIPFAIVVAVLLGLFGSKIADQFANPDEQEVLPSVIVGGAAPAVRMDPLPGLVPFTDQDLRTDGLKLLNFWASWCAPCRAEHPHLVTLSDRGIPVYGINYRDDPEKAQAFLAELGNPFAGGGADPRGRLAVDWGVYGLPETYILDHDGTVLYRLAGPLTSRMWHDRVLPALAEQGITLPRLD